MNRIEKLQDFLKESPNDNFLRHALALEYIKLDDDAKAQHIFEEILKDEPGYVGSYYQLGKLLERNGDIRKALAVYKTGMQEAKKANDNHAYNELHAAYDELRD